MYDLRIEGGNNDKWGNAPKLTKPTVKKNDFDFSAAVKKLANGDKAKGLADATADAVGKAPTSGAEVKGGAKGLADATADAVLKFPIEEEKVILQVSEAPATKAGEETTDSPNANLLEHLGEILANLKNAEKDDDTGLIKNSNKEPSQTIAIHKPYDDDRAQENIILPARPDEENIYIYDVCRRKPDEEVPTDTGLCRPGDEPIVDKE